MTKTDSDVSQAVETASSHYNFSYQIARVSGFHLHASTLTTTVQVASLPLLNTGPSKRVVLWVLADVSPPDLMFIAHVSQ
jgi:hypothetical protein